MKRLTISDIAFILLRRHKRSGFMSDDLEFIRKIFTECVHRNVMKKSENEWSDRVLSGIERSDGFVKSEHKGKRVFTIKDVPLF